MLKLERLTNIVVVVCAYLNEQWGRGKAEHRAEKPWQEKVILMWVCLRQREIKRDQENKRFFFGVFTNPLEPFHIFLSTTSSAKTDRGAVWFGFEY
jgi:hypothetical protein